MVLLRMEGVSVLTCGVTINDDNKSRKRINEHRSCAISTIRIAHRVEILARPETDEVHFSDSGKVLEHPRGIELEKKMYAGLNGRS